MGILAAFSLEPIRKLWDGLLAKHIIPEDTVMDVKGAHKHFGRSLGRMADQI
jgi:hypothetical protein